MKRIIAITVLILIVLSNSTYADGKIEDNLKSVLLGDYESGKILYSDNIDEPREMASLSKLMTYLVIMDEVSKGNVTLEDRVKVSKNAASEGGSTFNLREGEEIKMATLIDSILIVSANDSSIAAAEHIAGTEEAFVQMMNDKAKAIGLTSANFVNSNGMPKREGQNTMTTRDIFKLSRYIIDQYPQVLDITKRVGLAIDDRSYNKENTNPVLDKVPNIDGLKTGYTDLAGYCLISTLPIPKVEGNDKKFRLIGIVMGAETKAIRRDKTIDLLSYGIKNFTQVKILSKEDVMDSVRIRDAKEDLTEVYAEEDLYMLLEKGSEVRKEIIVNEDLTAPMSQGDVVGKVIVYAEDDERREVPLIIQKDVEKASIFMRILKYLMAIVGLID